jgi:hypothetical protein
LALGIGEEVLDDQVAELLKMLGSRHVPIRYPGLGEALLKVGAWGGWIQK